MRDDDVYVILEREPAPPAIPLRRRAIRALARFWPLAVWVLAIAAALWLYLEEGARGQALAYAETVQLRVAPSVSGRLVKVNVEDGQAVRAGDVLVVLDARDVEERVAMARAEIERLKVLVASQREAFRVEQIDRSNEAAARRCDYEADAGRLRLDVEKLRTDEAADRGERDLLDPQIERLKPLVEKRIVTSERHDEFVLRRSILEKRSAARTEGLAKLEERLKAWSAFAPEPLPDLDVEARLLPFELERRVQELRLADLEREREKFVLVAPADGHVESLAFRAGEWVTAGTDIAQIVVPRPGRIIAYVTDRQVPLISPGTRAFMRPRDHGGSGLEGRVVIVGPRIEQIPMRLRFIPTVPQWGRLITIIVEGPADLLPGEIYDVRFER